jgi:hypothetical protein
VNPERAQVPQQRKAAGEQEDAVLQRLAYLFRRAGADVTMRALLRAMTEYRKEGR